MARVLEELHTDHRNMIKLLTILERQLTLLAEQKSPELSLMVDIMVYMTRYPDLYHHPKEDLLFERCAQHDASFDPVVEELSFEHRSIIRSGIHLLELLRSMSIDVMQRRDELLAAGQRYVERQRAHMRKEEQKLFIPAAQLLEEADWQWLDERMPKQDDPLFGDMVAQPFRERYAQIMELLNNQ